MSDNNKKSNKSVKFETIETTISKMVVGTKLNVSKYNDNKNGYIGLKVGNKIVCSMYHLRDENKTETEKSIGCTNDVFETAKTAFDGNTSFQFIENGNSGDKTRNNKIVVDTFENVYALFKSVVSSLTTATATK